MRCLLLTTSYRLGQGDQLMSNELSAALTERGHTVDVLLLDWGAPAGGAVRREVGTAGEAVAVVPPPAPMPMPRLAQRAAKWLATPLRGDRAFERLFADRDHDVIIAATPALLFAPVLRRKRRGEGPAAILFIHDFFPIHHAEIGLIPRPVAGLLKRLEQWVMARFDIIYCNLPTNIGYLARHYRLPADQHVSWTPLWTRTDPIATSPRAAVRDRYGLPADRPIAVFGGQIVEGRGVEGMLEAAAHAQSLGSPLHFLFVGGGRLAHLVDRAAERPGSNVTHVDPLPRADYLDLISACDVGMIATVEGVSSHSFPTKLMDYLRVGIPAVATVEPGSAFADLMVDNRVGFSVPFGDVAGFVAALDRSVTDAAFREPFAAAARRLLDETLDVRHLALKIERDVAAVTDTHRQRAQAR